MRFVAEITDSEMLDDAINSGLNVVVDVWAEWCGPCAVVAPMLLELSGLNPHINFYKLNVDELPDLAKRFNVMSIPTLLFFKENKLADTIVGATSRQALGEKIYDAYGRPPYWMIAP